VLCYMYKYLPVPIFSFVLQHCWDIFHPSNGHRTPQAGSYYLIDVESLLILSILLMMRACMSLLYGWKPIKIYSLELILYILPCKQFYLPTLCC
jgi:hypothetical protein